MEATATQSAADRNAATSVSQILWRKHRHLVRLRAPRRLRRLATRIQFATETVALIDKNYLAYFSFTGPDRARYLNAILTNNIKDLQPGQGNISLLLNPQGRILAEIETQALPTNSSASLTR